jgi:hypothetical protein
MICLRVLFGPRILPGIYLLAMLPSILPSILHAILPDNLPVN